LLLVATGGAAWLPKSGEWLITVKNIIGVLLLAVAIGLLSRVFPGEITLLLLGLLGAGVALFLGALEFTYKTGPQRLTQLLGLFLLVYALACWYGALSGQTDPLRPLGRPHAALMANEIVAPANQWQTISTAAELERALSDAKNARQPLLLDWYADWCISCKVIEHDVLPDPGVTSQLTGYRLIRFDMTDSSAEQRALLDHYKLFGPPALLFFGKNGAELADLRVVGEINATAFAARIAKANDHIQ
jgi:thiol:disulfide interchange protein DsbD